MTSKILNKPESQVEMPAVQKTPKELARDKLKELIAEETRMVKGIFQCFETPGWSGRIMYRKYPGIPMFDRILQDGETYDIPLYVARHLNGIDASAKAVNGVINSCAYPIHSWKTTKDGDLAPSTIGGNGVPVPIAGVARYKKRFGFQSLEFGAMVA